MKCLRQYYKNRDTIKIKRKERYLKDKEKEKERYYKNRQYFIDKSKLNYRIRKEKVNRKQYFKNNILPLINNASN